MTPERSKRRDFLSLIFIAKSISKKLLTPPDINTKSNIKAKIKQAMTTRHVLKSFMRILTLILAHMHVPGNE